MTRRTKRTGRVLLTLDAETLRDDVLETAVGLARAYEAELVALFVKATDMLNMAALPFETTVVGPGGRQRTIDASTLEQRLDQIARDAEHRVARAAGSVPWSFRVATGHLEQLVAEQSAEFDLLTICGSSAARIRPGAAAGPASLLLLGEGLRRQQPVIAIFEGDTQILASAYRVAREFGSPLVVFISGTDPQERARLRRNARAWLARRRQPAQIMEPAPATLVEMARDMRPGLIVVAKGSLHCPALHDVMDMGASQAPMLEVPE